MTDTSQLGGGYSESRPDPLPTVDAVLAAAAAGAPDARLVVLAGPPGVGKSSVCGQLMEHVPNSFCDDKDLTAADFILEAAATDGVAAAGAYGTERYWRALRPLEYAAAVRLACANLIARRVVFAVGGWGPELAIERLWTGLRDRVTPAAFSVVHLDAPPLESWRSRMAARGSRSDSPWFDEFCAAVTAAPVWPGATRIATENPLHTVVGDVLNALGETDR